VKRTLFLLSVLLASNVDAQAPVPAGLLPEHAVPAPLVRSASFHGVSAVASRGDRFTVVTTNDLVSSTRHGLMDIDAQAAPLRPVTQILGNCGTNPGIASDGSSALVAWGCLGGTGASLVLADGSNRAVAIHAATRPSLFRRDFAGIRRVAWDGGQYVVLSTLETLLDPPVSIGYRAIATRVGPTGEILENDIDLGSGAGEDVAARDGTSVVVIANDGFLVRTMNAAGVVSPPHRLVTGSFPTVPAIAAGTDGFLVVWGDLTGVRAQHLDASGNPDGTPLLLDAAFAASVAVTAEDDGYRVAWLIPGTEIRAIRVASGSAVGAPAVVATGTAPALASNGNTTMLVWSAPDGTRARPIDAEGAGERVHSLAALQSLQSLAMAPSGVAVAWKEWSMDPQSQSSHLRDARAHVRVDQGTITHLPGLDRAIIIEGNVPPFVVRYADAPEVAFEVPSRRLFWTGDGFLAVWTGEGSNADPFVGVPLFVQRFDAHGNPRDASPRTVGLSFPLDAAYSGAAAAYNGVAVGASDHEILLTYIDPWATVQGVILRGDETTAIGPIATPQALANPIEITSDGTDFLVTWISNNQTIHSYIGSRRVLAGGTMPEEMRVRTGADTRKEEMSTFWTGEHYLVAWTSIDDGSTSRTISAIRIARDGTLLDYPEHVIGTIEGYAPQFAYRNGLLAVAYERAERVYWRYAGTSRRRAM
jgi:hypothetical protein